MKTLAGRPIKRVEYELKIIINDDADPDKDKLPSYDVERKMDATFHPVQLLVLHGALNEQQKEIMKILDNFPTKPKKKRS